MADLVVGVHVAYLGFVVLGGFLGLRDGRWLDSLAPLPR